MSEEIREDPARLSAEAQSLRAADAWNTQDKNVCEKQPSVTCDVCRDLLPLVADGVASEDSAALVAAHCTQCGACAALYRSLTSDRPEAAPVPDDTRILRRLKKKMALRSLLLAVGGVVGGAVLQGGTAGVYLVWWLPLVGVLAYFALRRRWWLAPALLGVLIAAGMTVRALWQGGYGMNLYFLIYPLQYGIGWALLTALGCGIGALLNFAFSKQKGEDET